MRLRYREIIGMRVLDADGKTVGRIIDLEAEPYGGTLCVTALLLGPAALVRRIGLKRPFLGSQHPTRVPWQRVAAIDGSVRLLPDVADEERAQ